MYLACMKDWQMPSVYNFSKKCFAKTWVVFSFILWSLSMTITYWTPLLFRMYPNSSLWHVKNRTSSGGFSPKFSLLNALRFKASCLPSFSFSKIILCSLRMSKTCVLMTMTCARVLLSIKLGVVKVLFWTSTWLFILSFIIPNVSQKLIYCSKGKLVGLQNRYSMSSCDQS